MNEENIVVPSTNNEPKKNNILKIILLIGIPLIIIILIVIYLFVISPKLKYDDAIKKYNNKDYKEAINMLEDLNGYKDSKEKLNSIYFEYGLQLIEEENFGAAARALEKTSTIGGKSKYLDYAKALSEMEFGNYLDAIQGLTDIGDFEKAPYYLKMAYYLYGESLVESKKYDEAIEQFILADDYEDAKDKIKMSNLLKAEKYYKEGSLVEAKAIYSKIDKDFEYEGIKVSDRLNTFKKYSGYVNLAGSWKGTNGLMTVKHIYKSNGSWDSWKNIYTSDLTLKCIIADDGSVKVFGSTNFFTFTNYDDEVSKVGYDNIEIPIFLDVKAGKPFSGAILNKYQAFKVKDGTVGYVTLTYSNNKIVLSYKLDDVKFSKDYRNLYTSTITYTKVK